MIWHGTGQASRLEEGQWRRAPEHDYELTVVQPVAATLEGRYDYGGAFTADLSWVDARWPVRGDTEALVESPEGRLQITGDEFHQSIRGKNPQYAEYHVGEGDTQIGFHGF